jgi:hypothetical protein
VGSDAGGSSKIQSVPIVELLPFKQLVTMEEWALLDRLNETCRSASSGLLMFPIAQVRSWGADMARRSQARA